MDVDPLAEVVQLLQPAMRFTKQVVGAGRWQVRRTDAGQPFYCAVLEGTCCLALEGREPVLLEAGDFVLVPAAFGVGLSSLLPPGDAALTFPVALGDGSYHIGDRSAPVDMRMLGGHCSFGSPDATLLVSLLPEVIHVRGQHRLVTVVQLASDEARQQRPARDVMLARLLEVLLIEALRSFAGTAASPGLVRGLADERVAVALRAMHGEPARDWSVVELARAAALSRSSFFERFSRAVGMAPMSYLLAWRMALAKDLLRRHDRGVSDVAERVGYRSPSTFSVAFARHVGQPPSRFARDAAHGRGAGQGL